MTIQESEKASKASPLSIDDGENVSIFCWIVRKPRACFRHLIGF